MRVAWAPDSTAQCSSIGIRLRAPELAGPSLAPCSLHRWKKLCIDHVWQMPRHPQSLVCHMCVCLLTEQMDNTEVMTSLVTLYYTVMIKCSPFFVFLGFLRQWTANLTVLYFKSKNPDVQKCWHNYSKWKCTKLGTANSANLQHLSCFFFPHRLSVLCGLIHLISFLCDQQRYQWAVYACMVSISCSLRMSWYT